MFDNGIGNGIISKKINKVRRAFAGQKRTGHKGEVQCYILEARGPKTFPGSSKLTERGSGGILCDIVIPQGHLFGKKTNLIISNVKCKQTLEELKFIAGIYPENYKWIPAILSFTSISIPNIMKNGEITIRDLKKQHGIMQDREQEISLAAPHLVPDMRAFHGVFLPGPAASKMFRDDFLTNQAFA